MMKHLKILFLAAISLVVFNIGAVVTAQDASVDDSTVQQRLEREGLNQAPDLIQVQERQMLGQEPSSGFVDENGNPISIAEYEEMRANQKGVFKKYPWLLPTALVTIVGAVLIGLKLKKK